MHAYKDKDEAIDAKECVEKMIKTHGWLPIEVFNILFHVKPGKPLPRGLGWDKTAIGDPDENHIRIEQRFWSDGKYLLVMPRPIKRRDIH